MFLSSTQKIIGSSQKFHFSVLPIIINKKSIQRFIFLTTHIFVQEKSLTLPTTTPFLPSSDPPYRTYESTSTNTSKILYLSIITPSLYAQKRTDVLKLQMKSKKGYLFVNLYNKILHNCPSLIYEFPCTNWDKKAHLQPS